MALCSLRGVDVVEVGGCVKDDFGVGCQFISCISCAYLFMFLPISAIENRELSDL